MSPNRPAEVPIQIIFVQLVCGSCFLPSCGSLRSGSWPLFWWRSSSSRWSSRYVFVFICSQTLYILGCSAIWIVQSAANADTGPLNLHPYSDATVCIFQLISCSDLENNYLGPIEMVYRLNQISPFEYGAHLILTIILLITGNILEFVLNVPLVIFNIWLYV